MITAELTASWTPATERLRFTLGEFRLWYWRFAALVLNTHFTELTPKAPVPLERLEEGVEALMIPSYPVESELPPITRLPHAIRYVPWHYQHYYTELRAPSMCAYLQALAVKVRHEHVRKLRRFTDLAGKIDCREFRAPEEMDEFHRLALAVSRKTYQEKLLGAGLPETEAFRRELAANARRDLVRGYILFHGAAPIAYGYCCGEGDILYYHNTGYDPEYGNWSPGTALVDTLLESAFRERRFRLVDFGHGNAQWKRSYATGSAHCAAVYWFRRTPRNLALVKAHRFTTRLSDTGVAALERLGIKARLKKLFRSL